jgi:hypothetical protein
MFDFAKSISSIAKDVQGNLGNVREILSSNPQLSPFQFPPAVQQAVDVAKGLGINVPPPEELTKLANGEIDKLLGTLGKDASSVLDIVDSVLGRVTKKSEDIQTLLNSISWLL